ncbi:MAG: VapB-type antitoxin [Candidatus Korarchaeum sp.]
MSGTTVRVSRSTIRMLESMRRKLNVSTLDETIRLLIIQQRRRKLEEVFGIDRGRIRPFSEVDRGEDSA